MPSGTRNLRRTILVYLPDEDYNQIEKLAVEQRLSMSAMARVLVARQLAAMAQSRDAT